MSEVEPIMFRPGGQQGNKPGGPGSATKGTANKSAPNKSSASSLTTIQSQSTQPPAMVCFDRLELNQILALYGRKVAGGDWRDYAMDFGKERAVFSVFARASECPLYRIEKTPKLARKQGAYALVSAHGLILKRGRDLRRVLGVLDKSLRLVEH